MVTFSAAVVGTRDKVLIKYLVKKEEKETRKRKQRVCMSCFLPSRKLLSERSLYQEHSPSFFFLTSDHAGPRDYEKKMWVVTL